LEKSGGVSVNNTATSGGISSISGITSDGTAFGVAGQNLSTTGTSAGVYGSTEGNGTGVTGQALSAASTGAGVYGSTESGSNGSGVVGQALSAKGTGAGVYGSTEGNGTGLTGQVLSATGTGNGVYGSTVGTGFGVYGVTSNASNGAVGVVGQATAATGATVGVVGGSASTSGIGVAGNAVGVGVGVSGFNNGTGWGVKGYSNTANSVGVEGFSPTVGVRGQSLICSGATCTPQTGVAGQFIVASGGTLLYGFQASSTDVWTSVFRVDSTGKGFFDGGTQTGGADFAESVAAAGSRGSYGPGDLLVLDAKADRQLTMTNEPYSTLVAGIYSTKPGVLATTHKFDAMLPGEIPLAVVGIVPCKVSAENGSIQRGDLLVTSSNAGYAMKGTDRSRMLGAVVGKAMESLDHGTGVIQVLVTLQ
jgi:hypothetical protein